MKLLPRFFPFLSLLYLQEISINIHALDYIACSWVNKCRFWYILFSTQLSLSWKLKHFEQCVSINQHQLTIVCWKAFSYQWDYTQEFDPHTSKFGPNTKDHVLHDTLNTRDSVLSGYPNTEKRVENMTCSRVFFESLI